MKQGFSMIELIFVIVIIGILAAVAIPRLSATRDDAKVSVLISNAKKVVNEAKNYYTSQGKEKWKNAEVIDVTDVPLYINSCSTQATDTKIDNNTFYMCNGNDKIIKIDTNDTHITISPTSNNSLIANAVKNDKAFNAIIKSYRLGGMNVSK